MGRLTRPTPAGEPRRCIEAEADCWALPASCTGAPEVDGGGALGREGPSTGIGFDFQGLAPELRRLQRTCLPGAICELQTCAGSLP